MLPIICLNYFFLVCVRLLFYSQFVSCAVVRGQKNHPEGKDGIFFEEQISMFQETANGRRRDEGVSSTKGLGAFSILQDCNKEHRAERQDLEVQENDSQCVLKF